MNILLFIPYGGVGGIERLAETLYDRYKRLGHDVTVVKVVQRDDDLVGFDGDEEYLTRTDLSDMSPAQRLLFYAKAPSLLAAIIRRKDIVHSISFGDLPNLISSLSRTKGDQDS